MHDHKHMTLLMHVAGNGPAPMFQEVHGAIRKAYGGDDIVSESGYIALAMSRRRELGLHRGGCWRLNDCSLSIYAPMPPS